MANPPKRVYWDACSWIAVIQDEIIKSEDTGAVIENRGQVCRAVIAVAKRGILEIATSAFSLVEVCKSPELRKENSDESIKDFFENPYVLRVNLDVAVGHRARQLMLEGYSKLKPPDASHLASAVECRAEEFHTYDGGLLKLNNRILGLDGIPLLICKPRIPPTESAPLLDELSRMPPNPQSKGH